MIGTYGVSSSSGELRRRRGGSAAFSRMRGGARLSGSMAGREGEGFAATQAVAFEAA